MVIVALAAPVLLGAAALAVDVSLWARQRGQMQAAADAAALMAAKELTVASINADRVQAVAEGVVAANLSGEGSGKPTVVATLVDGNSAVRVVVAQPSIIVLGRTIRTDPPIIQATATARTSGKRLCVIGLDLSSKNTVFADDSGSKITANGCSVQSFSSATSGLTVKAGAQMVASSFCTAGGYSGSGFSSTPRTCARIADPFEGTALPTVGGCSTHPNTFKATGSEVVQVPEGVYCNGLKLDGVAGSRFVLKGTYIVKNSPFNVTTKGIVDGTQGVGFYLTGDSPAQVTKMVLAEGEDIRLVAQKTGPMAGFILLEDPKASLTNKHTFKSRHINEMLGTIYTKTGELYIDYPSAGSTTSNIPYTIIVAKLLTVKGGAQIVINSNYDQTDVPVPRNSGGAVGGGTRLTQ